MSFSALYTFGDFLSLVHRWHVYLAGSLLKFCLVGQVSLQMVHWRCSCISWLEWKLPISIFASTLVQILFTTVNNALPEKTRYSPFSLVHFLSQPRVFLLVLAHSFSILFARFLPTYFVFLQQFLMLLSLLYFVLGPLIFHPLFWRF